MTVATAAPLRATEMVHSPLKPASMSPNRARKGRCAGATFSRRRLKRSMQGTRVETTMMLRQQARMRGGMSKFTTRWRMKMEVVDRNRAPVRAARAPWAERDMAMVISFLCRA